MIPHDKFIDKIKQYIDEKKLFSFGDHVIIGLSGGADSVCLLLVLKRLQQIYNLSITAIHVHHGIRGESAEHDLKFSRQLCEKEEIEEEGEQRVTLLVKRDDEDAALCAVHDAVVPW